MVSERELTAQLRAGATREASETEASLASEAALALSSLVGHHEAIRDAVLQDVTIA